MGFLERMRTLHKPVHADWIQLTELTQLEELTHDTGLKSKLIFKDSTRCGISTDIRHKLESNWDHLKDQLELYYLDLLSYREISDRIAEKFGIPHQSPQIILLKKGKAVLHRSHFSIVPADILNHLN